jgi:hypothetical protein
MRIVCLGKTDLFTAIQNSLSARFGIGGMPGLDYDAKRKRQNMNSLFTRFL